MHCLRGCATKVALWCVATSTYGLSDCLHTDSSEDVISLQYDPVIVRGIIEMAFNQFILHKVGINTCYRQAVVIKVIIIS